MDANLPSFDLPAGSQPRTYTREDLLILERMAAHEAAESFLSYRRFIHPKLKVGWWVREVAWFFDDFYQDLMDGLRPIMVMEAPPQHGKSLAVGDFVTYVAGRAPELQTLYASFSDRLSKRANLHVFRTMNSRQYQLAFPNGARVGMPGFVCNRELMEYGPDRGCFRNTTVRGSVTGEGLDLGIIDDPLKGRLEANSILVRDGVWDWLTDDFFTRFSESAGLLIPLTRWHTDDPVGRLIEEYGDRVKVIKYPALVEYEEQKVSPGGHVREIGEALFPEHKSAEFLMTRKTLLAPSSWESLYQQSPYVRSGGMFPEEVWANRIMEAPPAPHQISQSIRYWDKAGTKDGDGAYSCGVLMHELKDGRIVVADVNRGRWSTSERENAILTTAQIDGRWGVRVFVEQEPGSGGKESAENTVGKTLKGFLAYADRPTGDKIYRAEPYSAAQQVGNVWLVRADWNRAYIQELKEFPNGKYKDQVDASSGAYIKLVGDPTLDYSKEALS